MAPIADWVSLPPSPDAAYAVLLALMIAFWPLLIATIAAATIWWRRRPNLAAGLIAVVLFVLWAITAVPYVWIFGSQAVQDISLSVRRQTLQQPAAIAGIRLPAGTVVTYRSRERDAIESLDLPSEASIGGLPVVGQVNFEDGHPFGEVTLARDFTIAGVPCSAQAAVHFQDAKPASCTLARPSRIRGVPCAAGEVQFSGGLQCRLSSSYRAFGVVWPPGTYATVEGASGTFDISAPTTIYLLGSPLRSRAAIDIGANGISSINLTNGAEVSFHGCTIAAVDVKNGSALGTVEGSCALPRVARDYVALPAKALQIR